MSRFDETMRQPSNQLRGAQGASAHACSTGLSTGRRLMSMTARCGAAALCSGATTVRCSGDALWRAWKQSGLRQTLNATVSKVDNLVWLPRTRKNENWSWGPTVDKFCAGTCACQLRFYGDPGLTKVLPGPTVA